MQEQRGPTTSALRAAVLCTLAGASLSLASLLPETWPGLLAAAVCAAVFGLGARQTSLWGWFLGGAVFTACAFYWLPATIMLFGGFPPLAAYGVQLLFVGTSALQFVLLGFIYRRLQRRLSSVSIAFGLAWLAAEVLFPRMFPWAIGHAMIVSSSLSAVAEVGGVPWVSFLLVTAAVETALLGQSLLARRRPQRTALLLVVIPIIGVLGTLRNHQVRQAIQASPMVKIAAVQGNLDAKDKGDIRLLDVNLDTYRELSAKAVTEGAQVLLWPESVLNRWTPEQLQELRGTDFDPYPDATVPLLYGGLGFEVLPRDSVLAIFSKYPELTEYQDQFAYARYNAAFAIDAKGRVSGRYYKRALMPFGEYVPFSEYYPPLRVLLPQTGDFSVGKFEDPMIMPVATERGTIVLRALALICYEDLVPMLSRDGARRGANVLVNLTNDAWYGETAAPFQHHLLAQWRAVETRKYFIRVTNTGFTAIVDPLGATVASLPIFTSGYLVETVALLEGSTVYALIGDRPAWILSLILLFLAIIGNKYPRSVDKPSNE